MESMSQTQHETWEAVAIGSPCAKRPLSSRFVRNRSRRGTASFLKPIGLGRCHLAFRSDSENLVEAWDLESWHMLDWMVSVQLRHACGARSRYHWFKHRMPENDWFGLRRWLLWSGRRVESIGWQNLPNRLQQNRPGESIQKPQNP